MRPTVARATSLATSLLHYFKAQPRALRFGLAPLLAIVVLSYRELRVRRITEKLSTKDTPADAVPVEPSPPSTDRTNVNRASTTSPTGFTSEPIASCEPMAADSAPQAPGEEMPAEETPAEETPEETGGAPDVIAPVVASSPEVCAPTHEEEEQAVRELLLCLRSWRGEQP